KRDALVLDFGVQDLVVEPLGDVGGQEYLGLGKGERELVIWLGLVHDCDPDRGLAQLVRLTLEPQASSLGEIGVLQQRADGCDGGGCQGEHVNVLPVGGRVVGVVRQLEPEQPVPAPVPRKLGYPPAWSSIPKACDRAPLPRISSPCSARR